MDLCCVRDLFSGLFSNDTKAKEIYNDAKSFLGLILAVSPPDHLTGHGDEVASARWARLACYRFMARFRQQSATALTFRSQRNHLPVPSDEKQEARHCTHCIFAILTVSFVLRVFSLLLRVASAVIVGAFVLGVIGVVLVREGWQRARLNIFMRPPL